MKKTIEIKSDELFPAAFNADFRAALNHEFTEYTEAGGRGSCKSSFISICLLALLLQNRNFNALVCRKTAASLRNSVFEQIRWAAAKLGVLSDFRFTVSPMQATLIPTGQVILFSGADDPTRLKSLKCPRGWFALTWFEESAEFSESDIASIKLTTMRGGDRFWVFDSFNPPSSPRHWRNRDIARKKDGRLVHLSDYRTTPRQWLGDAFFVEAENMRSASPRAYENVFLGKATGTGRQVFENVTVRKITNKERRKFEWLYFGIDWGFHPDPFVFNAMSYDMKRRRLFIFDELRLYKHSNEAAAKKLEKRLKEKGLTADVITADSAEPKSIADFKSFGFNVRPSEKGAGSLAAGFKWLQGLSEIVIDGDDCPNAADEFSLYEHEFDKRTGEVLTGYPAGQSDHSLAAVRYAMERVWKRRGL